MGKRIKKTDNYFERVKQHANRTNYRYYFFDYLYFKGEQGHKMRSRCSGALMLSLYWWFIIVIPCIPLFDRNLPHTWYLLCGLGMLLFPFLFCLIRYRKDRTSALVNHYRHSSKNKIMIFLLMLLPMVLCGFEETCPDRIGLLQVSPPYIHKEFIQIWNNGLHHYCCPLPKRSWKHPARS